MSNNAIAFERGCVHGYLFACIVIGHSILSGSVPAAEPLPNAHAHNDYWHQRPLLDALDEGFTSVEADVFLVNQQLLVGHARKELAANRTLSSLYLTPLASRVERNDMKVHPNGGRFFLLVDIKTDANAAITALEDMLTPFRAMLAAVKNGVVVPGAVTIVVTGNRPPASSMGATERYYGLDGRLSDIDSSIPAHVMPMISDNWKSHFSWDGQGQISDSEQTKLRELVEKAHAAGRVLRFWETPESENCWRELRASGVDFIGTDQLARLGKFLRANRAE